MGAFRALSEAEQQVLRTARGIFGDVEAALADCQYVPPQAARQRTPQPMLIAVCCGTAMCASRYSAHGKPTANGRQSVCKQAFTRGVTVAFGVLLNKSCAGLFTMCIGCFRMFREDGYLHACHVMGQLHSACTRGSQCTGSALLLLRWRPKTWGEGERHFVAGPVIFEAFNDPAGPAAAAEIERLWGGDGSFSKEDLMLLGGKVELPRHLAPHVTAAWDRLAVHVVGDVAGFPTGLAKLVTHFAIFVQCGHLRQADAVRLICQYFPFNPPTSVMATFRAAVTSRRAQEAADAAAMAAPPAAPTAELSADDLADNGMTGGADVAMAGADEMSGGADVTMAEAGEGAPAGGQGAAQAGGGGSRRRGAPRSAQGPRR